MQTAAETRTAERPTVAELIRRERLPLPSHDLVAGNFRRRMAAVCQAEVNHREADFVRAANRVGYSTHDRYDNPACVEIGQFPHEAHAGAALNWLCHLGVHDSNRRGPWSRWERWTREERVAWLRRRRYLVSGFLRQCRRYRDARALIDRPAMREAA